MQEKMTFNTRETFVLHGTKNFKWHLIRRKSSQMPRNHEKLMVYLKNFPRCARYSVTNFIRKIMKHWWYIWKISPPYASRSFVTNSKKTTCVFLLYKTEFLKNNHEKSFYLWIEKVIICWFSNKKKADRRITNHYIPSTSFGTLGQNWFQKLSKCNPELQKLKWKYMKIKFLKFYDKVG